MGWAIMFLVLIALVIILSISLINWKIQIYKVIVQLNAILNRKTKKLVTVSLSDRRLEHLVEIINQIVSKDNIYLGEIQKKENELKENISCLSHDLRTPLTSIRGYLQLLSSAPDEKRAEYISALSGKALSFPLCIFPSSKLLIIYNAGTFLSILFRRVSTKNGG